MINRIFTLFKIARKLAKSDALKILSKHYDIPFIIKFLSGILSISFSKEDDVNKSLNDKQQLCKSIESMGPTFIKLGQFLATRPDIIGEELSVQLEKLQDKLPAFENSIAKKIIEKSLGETTNRSITNLSEPIAAASIAQVHKAQIDDSGVIKDVAIKILRPNIKKTFNDEIDALMLLAYFIENTLKKTKRLRLVEVVYLLKEITNHEMDLRFEAAAANEYAENTKNDLGFNVPKIYWSFTSDEVLTLDWIDGISIREKNLMEKKNIQVNEIASNIIQHFLRQAVRDGFFLFVLFGALLETAGGGQYFLDLAFAMVGKMRGGPAKAAILGSGMTGMISGSSVANTVTTGTFTIPIMKKTGFSKEKAGAIEVSSSVNGQIMPPVMGAAAFVMASFIGVTYFEVVKHAFLPAVISYIALFYISHLEALKLNLKGMTEEDVPNLRKTFLSGLHFLIPIFVLIYLLTYLRLTASYSIFYATIALISVNFLNKIYRSNENGGLTSSLKLWFNQTVVGFQKGAINMVAVGIAIATAGVIVGSVASTGLSTNLIIVIESIAKDNVIILILLTILLCLLLGMGLPTTANYVVVASLMSMVLVDVGNASGYIFPLIAVHLFVFYFGLMADVTPPVGLASYAAAGISGGDPLKTGIQAFWYSLRTGILPIVFLFNHELLLMGIENLFHAIVVILTSLTGILVFTSATQGWFFNKLRWYEIIVFLLVSLSLLSPGFVLNKFYPKYDFQDLRNSNKLLFEPEKEIHIKVTRYSEYGERYKLFVIEKNIFDKKFNLKDYGIDIVEKNNQIMVDNLKWNGAAKKAGFEMDDVLNELKVENLDRPNKSLVYPFAFILLIVFGYLNYKRK